MPSRTKFEEKIYQRRKEMKDNVTSEDSKAEITQLLVEHRDERKNKKRDLTHSVQTRWYRSPEVILLDKSYNEACDIWSAGVVLAELLRSTYSKKEKPPCQQSLFKGNSCYPISPINAQGNDVGENDQIIKIFQKFKNINEEQDFSFVDCDDSIGYLQQVMNLSQSKKDLKESFSKTSPGLNQILRQMLEINP